MVVPRERDVVGKCTVGSIVKFEVDIVHDVPCPPDFDEATTEAVRPTVKTSA